MRLRKDFTSVYVTKTGSGSNGQDALGRENRVDEHRGQESSRSSGLSPQLTIIEESDGQYLFCPWIHAVLAASALAAGKQLLGQEQLYRDLRD